ncbi:MAG: M1 family aminopeptidase, partial [Calditrichia bacterium]
MKRIRTGVVIYFSALLLSPLLNAQYSQHALLPEQLFYDVRFYDIALSIDPSAQFIQGSVGVEGEIVQNSTSQIILNFYDNLITDSVVAQAQTVSFNHANNLLTINLLQPLNNGDAFAVRIYYRGNPLTEPPFSSGLNFRTYSGQHLVYSYSWPYFAETFFPCKDHPSDKADSARLAISVPDIYEVACNGALTAVDSLPGNKLRYVWETHYAISPYHISINVYPFDVILSDYNSPVSGVIPLRYYLFPNHTPTAQPQLEMVVPQILEAFENRYGAFPFSGEKYGICESIISGGMEHQTILTMNYASFFSSVITHESGHEYFGNLISIADWGHIWLSEGFATYSEAIFREYWEGSAAYDQEIAQQMSGAGHGVIYISDASDPADIIPYNLVYLKASTVLHMLRYVMGDSAFFQMLHDYVTISPYRFKNIDTEQFKNFCEGYYGGDLDWFFDQWIYGDGKMAAEYYHGWGAGGELIFKIRSVPSFLGGVTQHSMSVPIQLSAFTTQIEDTLWIDSTITSKNYIFSDTTNLQILFDPGNKILKGAFTPLFYPEIDTLYLQQDTIRVGWKPFFDFPGYLLNIYREQNGTWTHLSTDSVSETSYFFQPTQAGHYGITVSAVQGNHRSRVSPIRGIYYSDFPLDQGILIIDETKNGNGSNMFNPTDAEVDAFYDSLLAGFNYQQLDLLSENRPVNVLDIADYSLLLWHHDVPHPSFIGQSRGALQAYLEAGGKMILSGLKSELQAGGADQG